MMRLTFAFAALALSATTPLLAETPALKTGPVEEKALATGKAARDPNAGYILVHSQSRVYGTFLRVPDDATREAYQKDWEEAFAKAKKKYEGALRSWESSAKLAQQTKAKVPAKPVEPTRENFSIGAIELRDMISFGPMFVFSKTDTRFDYLTAVKPGTYIYYGMVMAAPNLPAGGICNCMGSVKFEVKPGVVTDLGNFLYAAPKPEAPFDYATLQGQKWAAERKAKGKDVPAINTEVTFGLPASLKDWPSEKAEFSANGKINNFFLLPITRMAPVPGVLAYRRDTVIDVKTGQDLPNPVIKSVLKPKL